MNKAKKKPERKLSKNKKDKSTGTDEKEETEKFINRLALQRSLLINFIHPTDQEHNDTN